MQTLQQVAEERKGKAPERTPVPPNAPDATEPADKSGFLELRGFKHKLFVAVAGDKVFLYKNSEVGAGAGDPRALCMGTPTHRFGSRGRAAMSWGSPKWGGETPRVADPKLQTPLMGFGDPRSIAPAWVGGVSIPNLERPGVGGVRGVPGGGEAALPHLSAHPLPICPPRTTGRASASPTSR